MNVNANPSTETTGGPEAPQDRGQIGGGMAAALDLDKIPPVLKDRPQWVVWRQEEREGKPTKIPYQPRNPKQKASSTNPDTWGTLEQALNVAKTNGFGGIGYVFSVEDPYCGVDLDHCRDPETGGIAEWAWEIIRRLNSYTEISPSGTGVHILIEGTVPPGGNSKGLPDGGKVEMYSQGRYFTMTGVELEGTPTTIEPRQAELMALHQEVFGKPQAPPKNSGPGPAMELSNFALIDKAHEARNGHKFAQLWGGDTTGYASPSEADLALCGMLAFWTGPDPARIDRLFRQSRLMREKWERQDYRDRTITKALADATEFYSPRHGAGYGASGWGPATGGACPEPIKEAAPWPVMAPEAFHGLAGEFVRMVEPHTESDPVALLLQFLAGFGNQIGRGAYARVEADTHCCNLFAVAVGESSKARKGTSWGQVKLPLITVEPDWKSRVKSGLSSGEGLIFQVRDPIMKREAKKEKSQTVYHDVVVDPGEDDKRLLVVESEFANVLKQLAREGNILSVVMRDAWDNGDLATLIKNNPTKATGAHVSIIGHITKDELKRYLTRTEAGNGFGNRILWFCVKRSKVLPEGGRIHEVDFAPFLKRLGAVAAFAAGVGEVTRDPEARVLWAKVYPELSEGKPGMVGALTSRAEAQVLRLSMIYALLDGEKLVRVPHLLAALAVWDYCDASVRYIFGQSVGNPAADAILEALKVAPGGLTRTEINNLFGHNLAADRLQAAIGELLRLGFIRINRTPTHGRPSERFFLRT